MVQKPRKTLGFKKIMVYKIPPGGGWGGGGGRGKPYLATGLSTTTLYLKKILPRSQFNSCDWLRALTQN